MASLRVWDSTASPRSKLAFANCDCGPVRPLPTWPAGPFLPENVDLDGIKLHAEFRTRAKAGMPRKKLLEEARSSGGKKSLDDFASIFFGGESRSYETKTYTFDDMVVALNAVQPDDWHRLAFTVAVA